MPPKIFIFWNVNFQCYPNLSFFHFDMVTKYDSMAINYICHKMGVGVGYKLQVILWNFV